LLLFILEDISPFKRFLLIARAGEPLSQAFLAAWFCLITSTLGNMSVDESHSRFPGSKSSAWFTITYSPLLASSTTSFGFWPAPIGVLLPFWPGHSRGLVDVMHYHY
jgi:hypothetical protein